MTSCRIRYVSSARRLLLALIVFSCFCPFEARSEKTGGESIDLEILRGIELLYEGETGKAETLFRSIVLQRPADPAGHFYLAMVTWSKLTTGFWSRDTVEEYLDRIDRTISVAKSVIETGEPNSYTFFYLGGALGFKGRFHLMERKWLSSFSLALEAVDALKTCLRMDPSNRDVLLGLGIFDYYSVKFSGVMKFLTYLFLHRGDREEGLRKLHLAAEEAVFSSWEAKSVLLHIYLYMEQDHAKALPLAEDLSARFPRSKFFKYLEGVTYARLHMDFRFEELTAAMRTLAEEETSKTEAEKWVRRILYLESTRALFEERYEEARRKLEAILSTPDPVSDPLMIAYPLLKLGVIYDLEGQRENALELYTRVKEMDNGAGAQFLAEKFIKKPAAGTDPFLGY